MKKRILIADAQEVVALGLNETLSPHFDVVGIAQNAEHLFHYLSTVSPDVLIMDLTIGDADSLEILQKIRMDQINVEVLFYTGHSNPILAFKAHQLNARGYLLKTTSLETLIQAIETAANHQDAWTRREIRQINGAITTPRLEKLSDAALTKREHQVLQKIAAGRTNKEIAEDLKISYETVKEHVQHILRKVYMSDRTQAAIWGVATGLV